MSSGHQSTGQDHGSESGSATDLASSQIEGKTQGVPGKVSGHTAAFSGTAKAPTSVPVYVIGDRSIDVALIHKPKSPNAGTRKHYADYRQFCFKGGADHMVAMIRGAKQRPFTSDVTMCFKCAENVTSPVTPIDIEGTLDSIEVVDGPTIEQWQGKIAKGHTPPTLQPSAALFGKELKFEFSLPRNGHLNVTTDHKSSEFGVRPNLVKRAWEMHLGRVYLDVNAWKKLVGGELKKLADENRSTSELKEFVKERKKWRRSEFIAVKLRTATFHAQRGVSVHVKAEVNFNVKHSLADEPIPIRLGKNSLLPIVYTELSLFKQTPHSDIPKPMHEHVYRRAKYMGQGDPTSYASMGIDDSEKRDKKIEGWAKQAVHGKLSDVPCVVCVNDDGLGFAQSADAANWLAKVKKQQPDSLFWVIKGGKHANFNDTFYTTLGVPNTGYPDNCLAVTSADAIRAGSAGGHPLENGGLPTRDGIRLSHDRSWESVLEDLRDAINNRALMSRQGLPKHLIVMFGLTGCAYIDFMDQHNDPRIHLLFDPQHTEHDYAPEHRHGGVAGALSIFTAKIAEWLSGRLTTTSGSQTSASWTMRSVVSGVHKNPEAKPDLSSLLDCCKDALRAARRSFDYGYGPSVETLNRCKRDDYPTLQIFYEKEQHKKDRFATMELPAQSGLKPGEWSILGQHLRATEQAPSSQEVLLPAIQHKSPLERGAFELGSSIVTTGLDTLRGKGRVRNKRRDDAFPVLEIGKLVTVDRGEIEGLRTIQSVFEEYLRGHEQRPVSVAVFGTPGSGKSWGVREVLSNLELKRSSDATRTHSGGRTSVPIVEMNMTQLSEPDHLASALLEVTNACIDGKIPAVFFDEFDTKDGERFKWIGRFLSVMEDGQVFLGGKRVKIGRAILVFAGGIHESFEKFENPGNGLQQAYRDQKVPDFVSRLMGFLNVAGPNPRKPQDPTEVAQAWIRRAVQVRGHLEQTWRQKQRTELAVDSNTLDVDPRVINALLRVDKYKHGSRSLRAVLEMCTFGQHESFDVSMVPPRSLLTMHVTEDFEQLLAGGL